MTREAFDAMDWPEKCGALQAYVGLLAAMLERHPPADESDARVLRDAKALSVPFSRVREINAEHAARHRADAGGTLNYDTLVAYDQAQGRR